MHAGRKKRAIAGMFVAATVTAIATGVWAQAQQPQQTQTNPARRMGQQTVPPSTPPATGTLRPWLQVADAQQPVRLSGLHVQGQVVGEVARTTLEMHFHNPNNRVLEGQLQFPLLPGQEVTGFALDIDGVWRDAVPVEKTKGRQVFEDVTRAQIDPALLEQTQGNQFRLRVYPLPANGQRRVRVTITERLQADAGGQAHWRLLLPAGEQLDQFSGQLMVQGLRSQQVRTVQGLQGQPAAVWREQAQGMQLQWQRGGYRVVQQRAGQAQAALEFAVALPQAPAVLSETRADTNYFYVDVQAPHKLAVPRKAPQDIALVWDASGSGASRDHASEWALLDAYFKAIGNTRVHLTLARDTAEQAGSFTVQDGDWSALRQALQAVAYDGATSVAALQPAARADVALLFTDGMLNFGVQSPANANATTPMLVVHASTSGDVPRLQQVARSSGGAYVDLMQLDARQGARLLQMQPLRLLKVEGNGLRELVASPVNAQGRLAVAGQRMAQVGGSGDTLRLHWQLPDGSVQQQAIALPRQPSAHAWAASLWARLMVDELSANYQANRQKITELGKQFTLLTRTTSLIVLDNVQDYVRHDIEPPQPLQDEYARIKAQQKLQLQQDEKRHLDNIARRFEDKQAWWRKDFPKGPRPKPQPEKEQGLARSRAEMAMSAMPAPMAAAAPSTEMLEMRREDVAMDAAMHVGSAQSFASKQSAQSGAAAAHIQLKKWMPDSPYARRLRAAAADEAYAVYLSELPNYRNSTAFYLDAADIFFEKKQPELALRILSNLAEMDLENRHVLRILGYRLLQAGRADLAIPVLEKVLDLAPDEPQSWRDIGLARAQAGQNQQAVDALYEVVRRPWHNRFPDVELIALAELNAIVARSAQPLDTSAVDPRLLKNLPLDLRVVLSWDADNTDIDLWVTDPNGEKVFYANALSYQGGRISRDFTGGYGPEEFSLKHAKPGKYRVQAEFYGHRQQIVAPATTLQLELFTNYGKPAQQSRAITLRLAGQKEVVDVGEFEVDAQGRLK